MRGMLAVEPRDLRTGTPVDIAALMSDASPLRTLVNEPVPGSDLLANRLIAQAGSGRSLRQALVTASDSVRASHLIGINRWR